MDKLYLKEDDQEKEPIKELDDFSDDEETIKALCGDDPDCLKLYKFLINCFTTFDPEEANELKTSVESDLFKDILSLAFDKAIEKSEEAFLDTKRNERHNEIVNRYRSLAALSDDEAIDEDDVDSWSLSKVAAEYLMSKDDVLEELLK